jgi:peptidoglycan/LPS O-acetylase OafA/YrhL
MRTARISLTPRVVPGQRIDAIDELKGVAIALVVLYHSLGLLGDQSWFHGEIGVDVFLLLSGFTLAMNSATMPLPQFFTRRLFRIYPAYWVALGLTVYVHEKIFGQTFDWGNIWTHILGVHGYARVAYFTAISDPFWFISMIIAAYLVFACIRKHLDNLSLVCAVGGGLTLFATVFYQNIGNAGGFLYLGERIPDFFAGLIAGRLLVAGTAEIKFNLLLGLGLLCFYYDAFFRSAQDTYLLPAIGIVAAWIGARQLVVRTLPGRFFLSSFSLLGVISYEVYLFHQPIIREYNSYVWARYFHVGAPTHAQLLEGVFVGLGVTCLLSVAVHQLLGWAFSRYTKRRLNPVAIASA